jgi:putrescine transport system ATP-binding protein
MMFQSYALFPHMTVEDNVAFGLRQDGLPRAEVRARVADMLALVQLTQFGKRKPHQLSGGQKQRVALARALVKQPKLLLLDEPLGALDKKLREQTQFELVNIQDRAGVTFVVVTHDQEEAMTLSSRIGVMNQGKIVQTGTPTEIYEFPGNRFVADFIGSVNMFEGRIVDEDNDFVRITSEEAGCNIFINHGVSAAPDSVLWVAVRPEKIQIDLQAPAEAGDNQTTGVVQDIAYMGDMSIYNVRLESGKTVKVTQPNLIRHTEDRITWDDKVYLYWDPASGVVLTA